MSDRSHSQLILGSVSDPELFESIFDRHFAPVHRYLRRRVGDELASELGSEVFLQAFRTRAGFDPERITALPWLYAIASNLVRMHCRTEERRLRAYARAGAVTGVGLAEAVLDETVDRLDAAALGPAIAAALAELSVPLREVLLLHAWAGLSNDEIAEALGCSTGAVRVRLSRARDHVKRQLREQGKAIST